MVKTTARKAMLAACVAALIAVMALRAAGTVVAAEPPSGTPPDIFDPQADETPPTITMTRCVRYEGDRTSVLDSYFDPATEDIRPGECVQVVVRVADGVLQSGVDVDTVCIWETSPQRYRHDVRALGSDQYEAWLTAEAKGTWRYEFRASDSAGNAAVPLKLRLCASTPTTSSPSGDTRGQEGGTDESEEDNWGQLFSEWDTLTESEKETVKKVARAAEDQGLHFDARKEKYYQVCGAEGVSAEEKQKYVDAYGNPDEEKLLNNLPWVPGGKLLRCRDTYDENQAAINALGGSATWTLQDRATYRRLSSRVWYYWDGYTGEYESRRTSASGLESRWQTQRQLRAAFPRGDVLR